jgi:hypothetical protein
MLLSKGYQLTLKLYNAFVFNVMAIRLFFERVTMHFHLLNTAKESSRAVFVSLSATGPIRPRG